MLIRKMLNNSGYPSSFTNSISGHGDKYMIPPNFFKIAKESMLMEFPYCPQNELVDKAKKINKWINNTLVSGDAGD